MTRYKNDARLEQEERELEELERKAKEALEEKAEKKKEEEEDETLTPEEQTFKKRYGDLRRYNQTLVAEKDKRIKELEEQLSNSAQVTQFPKTKEEVEAWKSKYPDVFGHIQTMILQNNQELNVKYQEGLKKVKEIEDQMNQDKAKAELHKLHPDFFGEILPDPKFKDWAESQPQWMIDVLYGWDAIAAARVIDLYKADMGVGKKTPPSKREAAEGITTRTNSGPDLSSDKPKWSDSKVAALTGREYEKFEDEIMEAMRTGKYDYDLTGAAR